MVDLRREFADLIEDYGSYYLLVRSNRKKHCKCVDKLYNTAEKKCPICLGTGYVNVAEKVKGRDSMAAMPVSLPRLGQLSEPGNISIPAKEFFLDHTSRPEKEDLIVVCQWDGIKPIFDEYTEIHRISYVQALRADDGRIEYFIASAEGQLLKKKAILHNIQTNANRINYYVTVR
jgi:hypothetical protein